MKRAIRIEEMERECYATKSCKITWMWYRFARADGCEFTFSRIVCNLLILADTLVAQHNSRGSCIHTIFSLK